MAGSLYDFTCTTIDGQTKPLADYRNKVLLIVNTASKCGFTPQFTGLEELHKKYADKGLAVLGFPCNQFGHQDPGSNGEIGEFCQRNYGVSFQMFGKIDVNGESADPLYQYIKAQAPGILGSEGIKWNFTKFLVDKHGKIVDRFAPQTTPEKLAEEIEKLL